MSKNLSKCLIREMDHADFKLEDFDDDSWVDEKGRTPFAGLQVILYLRAGTDSAQPIRVVRDSCGKG